MDSLSARRAVVRALNEQNLTLVGRTCAICGNYDCTREHKISVSLPTKAEVEKAHAEETQDDYWTVCKRCGFVKAYCKCTTSV